MKLRERVAELEAENARLNQEIDRCWQQVSDLKEKLADNVFPKEVAIEDFERDVLNATKNLLDSMRNPTAALSKATGAKL